ncbi:MAG: RluA family pseudouridine synthase [Saprospiraceae bacterium]|nr:RluA family pseudouridine synthase [Saprospiraceae bacterium]MDW8229143.1 RluA family pseudouridine synthase [Saprospiraceae bacterium]
MPKPDLLYEDEAVIVVNKPAGLLTIADRFGNADNLHEWLERRYGRVLVVHRLDRETSGVLCFARTEEAHRHLSLQFENHTVDKFYLALVDGVVQEEEGEIDKPIGPHPTIAGKMVITASGKPSLTFYRVLERFQHFTLVEALLKTGRTHQARVHLQSIGYPLTVDALYGRRSALYLSEIKGRAYKAGKFSEEERPLLARTALHAFRLRFLHPTSEERMEFRAEPPKDLSAVLQQLRKWGQ